MNPQPEQDLERHLQIIEAELNQASLLYPVSQPKQSLQQQANALRWGKLIFLGVAALVSFAILQAVLKLVTALICLAILGALMYLIYQFFPARSSETKD